MDDKIKMLVLILIVAFIASMVTIKYRGPEVTNIIIQPLISCLYFLSFCTIYYVAINIFSGNSNESMFTVFEILTTSAIFGVWIFSTTYLSDFFSNSD